MPVLVTSSNLAAIDYAGGELVVMFRNGSKYAYTGVPESVVKGLLAAQSKGSYFHSAVKNGGYPYRKL